MEDVGAHEREDRHDVVNELVGNKRAELGEEEESLVRGLRVDGGCRERVRKCALARKGILTAHEVQNGSHADGVTRDARRRLRGPKSAWPSQRAGARRRTLTFSMTLDSVESMS